MKTRNIEVVMLFAGITAALTLAVRIPIPGSGGYLNAGDMAVIFSGLFLGGKWGAMAGGIGSAAADIIGGFSAFAPVTLIAKGIEAFLAGAFKDKYMYVGVGSGVLSMVAVYFVAEIYLPGLGYSAAVSELPFNLIQAAVGGGGGIAIFKGVALALPKAKK